MSGREPEGIRRSLTCGGVVQLVRTPACQFNSFGKQRPNKKEPIGPLGDACIIRQLCAKVNTHHHYSAKLLRSVVLERG